MLQKLFIKNSFNDDIFEYDPNSLNIFVGPNNSGKSLLLREIHQFFLTYSPTEKIIVDSILTNKMSQPKIQNLKQINNIKKVNGFENHLYFFDEYGNQIRSVPMDDFDKFSNGIIHDRKAGDYQTFIQNAFGKDVLLLNGAERLNSMEPKEYSTNPESQIINPVNSLLNNQALFKNMQKYIFDAFNLFLEIFIDGGQAQFVLAKEEMPSDLRLSVKPEATNFLLTNSVNNSNTSDGRKAYLGILSEVIAGNPSLLLLDEPEAFLHPPLARKLGNVVSKLINDEDNKQVFIATHSADFIMGCIEARVSMNLVRLTFENETSTFKPINQDILEKIINNPLLKSTNVLKAIFYQKVIITESDSDRAFYEEINSRLLEYKPEWGIKDCLFINAQNKQTTGVIVKTLREIGVNAIAIVDLDFIKDGKGEFADKYLSPANIPKHSHSGLQSNRTVLKEAFEEYQSKSGSKKPEFMKKEGIEIFRDSIPDLYQMSTDFIDTLNSYGLFPVPIGELESWLRDFDIPGHGSNWLTAIFEKMGDDPKSKNFTKPTEDDVWRFMSTIKQWFDDPLKKGMSS